MKKTVIFLGAGASKADGAPLQRELFKSYFEACSDEELNDRFDLRHSRIKKSIDLFFAKFFDLNEDLNRDNDVFPTFEEALGVLDLAIERNEEYKSELGSLYQYRAALIFSMAQAIQYKIERAGSGVQGQSHMKLAEHLRQEISEGSVSFVSTNYDVILDNVLMEHFQKVDYGFYPLENLEDVERGVKLFKIHGSLNWKYCPVCKHIEAQSGQHVNLFSMDNPSHVTCGYCGSDARYIIVPPTYYKDMSNVYIANIWNNAEKLLRESEHVIFSGYSLPSADMHIKYLLKRAELNRSSDKKFKATVINYYSDKITGAIEKEQNRYRRLFKNDSDIKYIDNMSFQDFAENPFDIVK